MFPSSDRSKNARDTWANLIPNPYQNDTKWRSFTAARGKITNIYICTKYMIHM